MALCYFALGSFCIAGALFFANLGENSKLLFVLGAICYSLCPFIALWGRYAEGKGKLLHLGNKLLRTELKPNEFIKQYQEIRNSAELVIGKPSYEVLMLVAMAYDCLDERENCLVTADEMIAAAPDKKKTFAKLLKCSFLFSYDRIDEAEAIVSEARSSKLNFMSQALLDTIGKSDRAMAIGDYKTVEAYNLKTLSQTVPKLDPLTKLILHYKLGEVYEKQEEREKAIFYYQYAVEHAGETAIKEAAQSALERLQ